MNTLEQSNEQTRTLRIKIPSSLDAELVIKNVPLVMNTQDIEKISALTTTISGLGTKETLKVPTFKPVQKMKTKIRLPKVPMDYEFTKGWLEATRGMTLDQRFNIAQRFFANVSTKKDLYSREFYLMEKNKRLNWGLVFPTAYE